MPQPTPPWRSPNPAGPLCPQEGFSVNPGWLLFVGAAAPGPLLSPFVVWSSASVPKQEQPLSLQGDTLAWPLLKWQMEIGKKEEKLIALYHKYCRAKQGPDLTQCSNFYAPVHLTATAVRTKLWMRPASIATREKQPQKPAAPGLQLRDMAILRSRWKSVALVGGTSPELR